MNISKELRREVVATLAKREQNANYLNALKDSLSAASLRLKIEILEALTSNSLKLFLDHAIDALSTAKSITEPPIFRELIHLFWEAHWRSLDSRSPLFELAPRRIQKNILRKQYSSHIWSLSELFSFRPTSSGLWSAPDVCGALNKTDQDLAEKWLPMRAASAEDCARMLSARAAERIASWFYENLGHEVEDIASHQLTGVSSSWKTFDLLIDGNKPVDVKNARLPNSARAFHLEHIVPRFKQDRSARDVVIAGVASPFLSLRELTKRDPCDPHHREFTYLGETSKEKISQICTSFKNGTLELTGTRNPSPIQPWYFDYPDEWFKSLTEECARLKEGKQPENLHSELLYDGSPNRFPLAQHIAAGLPLPDWLIRKLTPWHRGFIANLQKLHDNRRPRLAELFLTILSDFLNNIHTPSAENYAPSAYRSILYQKQNKTTKTDLRPLGIEDPLNTIGTLCRSLQVLWNNKENTSLERFQTFRMSLGGILQAREKPNSAFETILAYCGGKMEGKDPCGYSPLILGIHKRCEACTKLVCPQCRYCSDKCQPYRETFGPQYRSYDEDADEST